MISRRKLSPRMPPLGLLVNGGLSNAAERPNCAAISSNRRTGYFRAWRLIHKRHKFVGKPRHGAADADAAHIRATPDSGHPSSLWNIAVHHRAPASQFHDALRRSIHFGEVALLVIAGSIATLMHCLSEEPGGAQLVVERNHGSETGYLVEKIEHRFHKVVGLHRTSRNVDDRQAGLRLPIPAE